MDDFGKAQVEQLREDGYVVVKNFFSEKECAHFKKILLDEINKGKEAFKKSPIKPKNEINSNRVADVPRSLHNGLFQDIAHRNSEFMSLAKDQRLINILSKIYGDSIKGFHMYLSSSIFKNFEVTNPTEWHIDMPYWKGTTNKTVVWIPLNKVTKENGCLKYIARSHNKNYVLEDSEHVGMYKKGYINPNRIDESDEVFVELEIGDVAFHHCNIVHGSEENTLKKERYAIIFVYQPGSDTSNHRDGPGVPILKDI
jgi:ectoine hydroxylase-related dioxygenase (phytanoyl-CoA dioxygenase family)